MWYYHQEYWSQGLFRHADQTKGEVPINVEFIIGNENRETRHPMFVQFHDRNVHVAWTQPQLFGHESMFLVHAKTIPVCKVVARIWDTQCLPLGRHMKTNVIKARVGIHLAWGIKHRTWEQHSTANADKRGRTLSGPSRLSRCGTTKMAFISCLPRAQTYITTMNGRSPPNWFTSKFQVISVYVKSTVYAPKFTTVNWCS